MQNNCKKKHLHMMRGMVQVYICYIPFMLGKRLIKEMLLQLQLKAQS